MNIKNELLERSQSTCELCARTDGLDVYEVPPVSDGNAEKCLLICAACRDRIESPAAVDMHHWRCLNDSMWSQVPAVQVMAWRLLNSLRAETWAADLLDMLYLDDALLAWAKDNGADADADDDDDDAIRHLDSNGTLLAAGDSVTLIKDLVVKGAGFTAKRGTAVRNISLVPDNALHIEGRVSGQQIVILTEFVKK